MVRPVKSVEQAITLIAVDLTSKKNDAHFIDGCTPTYLWINFLTQYTKDRKKPTETYIWLWIQSVVFTLFSLTCSHVCMYVCMYKCMWNIPLKYLAFWCENPLILVGKLVSALITHIALPYISDYFQTTKKYNSKKMWFCWQKTGAHFGKKINASCGITCHSPVGRFQIAWTCHVHQIPWVHLNLFFFSLLKNCIYLANTERDTKYF
jgi:hypothetical protein